MEEKEIHFALKCQNLNAIYEAFLACSLIPPSFFFLVIVCSFKRMIQRKLCVQSEEEEEEEAETFNPFNNIFSNEKHTCIRAVF